MKNKTFKDSFFSKIWNALHDTKTNKWSENKRKRKRKKKNTQPITGRVAAPNNARQQFSLIIKTKRKGQYFVVFCESVFGRCYCSVWVSIFHPPRLAHFWRRVFPCSVCARSSRTQFIQRGQIQTKLHPEKRTHFISTFIPLSRKKKRWKRRFSFICWK